MPSPTLIEKIAVVRDALKQAKAETFQGTWWEVAKWQAARQGRIQVYTTELTLLLAEKAVRESSDYYSLEEG